MFDSLILCDPAVPVLTNAKDGLFGCAQFLASNVFLEHKPPIRLPNCLLVKVPFLYPRFEHAQGSDETATVLENMGDISQIVTFCNIESLYVILDVEPLLWTGLMLEGSLGMRCHILEGEVSWDQQSHQAG